MFEDTFTLIAGLVFWLGLIIYSNTGTRRSK